MMNMQTRSQSSEDMFDSQLVIETLETPRKQKSCLL